MAYFKKFVVALKKMGIKINPGVVLMLILAVTIAVVLWRWWLAKKRSADEAGTETSPKPQVPAGPAAVPKDRFLKIWRRFTSELPSIVRRSIYQYQPMVVLGGLSAGKTALITRYTDWQRQVRYLVGSQLDDPDLQLYLGSRVLVLELPPSVLVGAGRGLRESLLALFRILFSRRTPIVVVALNPIELQQMTPDELRALADAVRGKINLLSFVRRKPIEVRLAVTHMDRISGFAELAEVVRQQSGSLELPMPAQAFGTELEVGLLEQLGQLAKVRSTALLSLSATRYLKVISFLKEAPQILAPVGRFARALLAPEPMSIQPSLSSIHLTSAQLEEPVSAPFWAPEPLEDRLRSPLAWHRAAAVSVAAILCCGLMWTYFSERGLWVQIESALQRYAGEAELRQRPELERALRAQIMGFVHRTTFPSFFGGAERRARRVVAERLHQDFVLHNLRDALAHPRGIRRAVYLSALAGFRPEGDVALLLDGEDALGQWELSTGLKGAMIRDYVDVVGAFKRDFDAVPALASPAWKDGSKDNVNNIDTLYAFAQDVRAAVRRNVIDGRSLADIRQQAGRLRQGLTEIAISPDVAKILQARASEDPDQADVAVQLTPHLIELQAPDLLGTPDRRTELRSFLELVESTQVGRSPRAAQRYLDICEWLSTTLKIPTSAGASNSDPTDIEVAVDGRLLRGSEWLGLTRDHTVVEVVRSYLSRPSRETAVFFTPGVEYPSLVMNPDTRGSFLFSGRARIAGRFTRTALLSDVAPVLECHAKVLPALGRIDSKTAKD
ncbi:MAG: type VI secretion protein IcmF/TssM N-terminal domain-containing protein, partial [Myxococcota bacterium]